MAFPEVKIHFMKSLIDITLGHLQHNSEYLHVWIKCIYPL